MGLQTEFQIGLRIGAGNSSSGSIDRGNLANLSDPKACLPSLPLMSWTAAKTDLKLLESLVWAEVERRYERGASAGEICRAFGFSSSTFHAHARAGGWRRLDAAPRATNAATGEPRDAGATPSVLDGLALTAATLEADAALLARKALDLLAHGDGKAADAALKAADRLLRIKRRLGSEPETNQAEEAVGRLMAMSDAELEVEIKRLAGAG